MIVPQNIIIKYTIGVKAWSGRRKTNSRKVGLNVDRKRQH